MPDPAAGRQPSDQPSFFARGAGARLPIVDRAQHKKGCCTAEDAQDARRVADRLNIPFYALDFQDEFGRIIDYFVAEYATGRTPNPCVVCNTWLKFGRLFDYADSAGADFVATGHYARIVTAADGSAALAVGVDEAKDQSYALFGIERRFLSRMLLPVGGYRKPQIRELAQGLGLRVADKKESQEICFVPDGDHAAFIRRRVGESATAGAIVTTDGREVGRHDGVERFTIGQRKGLGVALGGPRFVVRLEPDTGRVVIGSKDELARDELVSRRHQLARRSADGTAALRRQNPLQQPPRPGHDRAAAGGALALPVRAAPVRRGPRPGRGLLCRRAGFGRRLDRITTGRPDLMLTLLQISDLHFGPMFLPKVAEALLRAAAEIHPDILVASGDFTQRAKPAQFADARAFLDRLPAVPRIVVPGNHDIPLYRVHERLLSPYGLYCQHISAELDTVLARGDATIVALNTTAPWLRVTDGRIQSRQLELAAQAFAASPRGAVKIVVAHHHFAPAPDVERKWDATFGAEAALQRFEQLGVDLILGGHLHRAYTASPRDAFPQHGDSGLLIVECGTSTSSRGRGRERGRNSLNVLQIDERSITVTHWLFSPATGDFAPANRHVFPRRGESLPSGVPGGGPAVQRAGR